MVTDKLLYVYMYTKAVFLQTSLVFHVSCMFRYETTLDSKGKVVTVL